MNQELLKALTVAGRQVQLILGPQPAEADGLHVISAAVEVIRDCDPVDGRHRPGRVRMTTDRTQGGALTAGGIITVSDDFEPISPSGETDASTASARGG